MPPIRLSFNKAASHYNAHAFLQAEVALRLSEKLNVISINPEVMVDLGSGTGLLSDKLIRKLPQVQLICVDFAQQSLQENSAHHKVCADAYQLPFADKSIDFIASNLMMQWCQDLKSLFDECHRVLKPSGLILYSTFGPDTLKELKRSWSVVDSEPHVNGFTDMHDIGDQMLQSGFNSPVMEMETLTLTYDKVIDLMRDLKGIGAQTVRNRSKSLTGKTKFNKMIEMYEAFRKDGKLPATYEIIYGHAWKSKNSLNPIALDN
jgi:malonyl-CoA O-methyltransferase